ncbi:PROTEIN DETOXIFICATION [Salix purpurea]|uniref:PROTEIN DETOXIFICATION n=1 Tax=Salix purpurea TaxID=77065 RepID=A0A9Q0SXI0_SALPP|nr:PROTEIN DETOXIFICATION [Salix purpurea]
MLMWIRGRICSKIYWSHTSFFIHPDRTETVVMIQIYGMCVGWGEPFSQTAQSFMPELLYGSERSSEKARVLLKSLVITGAILGLLVASIGASIPRLLRFAFTSVLNARFFFALQRLLSPNGIPNQEPPVQYKLGELSKIKLFLSYDVLTRPIEHSRPFIHGSCPNV